MELNLKIRKQGATFLKKMIFRPNKFHQLFHSSIEQRPTNSFKPLFNYLLHLSLAPIFIITTINQNLTKMHILTLSVLHYQEETGVYPLEPIHLKNNTSIDMQEISTKTLNQLSTCCPQWTPSQAANTFKNPQCMPEAIGITEPYIQCFFLYLHASDKA